MPRIFGQEIQGKTLWIVLGVIAAAVALVVYVRARSGSAAGAAPEAGADYGGGGGGGGIPVAAPSQQVADTYTSQLQGLELEAARFGLDRQRKEAEHEEKSFGLQYALQSAYTHAQEAVIGAQAGAETEYYRGQKVLQGKLTEAYGNKKLKVECGKGESSYIDPQTGQYACKKSGKSGLKSLGDTLGNAVQAVIRGAGQGAAAGAELYTQRAIGGAPLPFQRQRRHTPHEESGYRFLSHPGLPTGEAA